MLEPWQTRASEFHPYLVDAIDKLPESLCEAAKAALPPGEKFIDALVLPPDYRSEGLSDSHPVPGQALIFTDAGALNVRAGLEAEAAPSTIRIQPDTLLAIRTSHLLLYGRLEMLGSTECKLVKIDMEFNDAGWDLMAAEWRTLISRAVGVRPLAPDEARTESQMEKALLAAVPAKFADGLCKYGLYTGESLVGTVFQPGIWSQTTLAMFDQQITPNTLLALTNASVLIVEEERALVRKSEQHGLVVTRIPRQGVADVQLAAQDALDEIKFSLARCGVTTDLRLLLESEAAERWRKFWVEQNE